MKNRVEVLAEMACDHHDAETEANSAPCRCCGRMCEPPHLDDGPLCVACSPIGSPLVEYCRTHGVMGPCPCEVVS